MKFQLVRYLLLHMDDEVHTKNWRPQILVLTSPEVDILDVQLPDNADALRHLRVVPREGTQHGIMLNSATTPSKRAAKMKHQRDQQPPSSRRGSRLALERNVSGHASNISGDMDDESIGILFPATTTLGAEAGLAVGAVEAEVQIADELRERANRHATTAEDAVPVVEQRSSSKVVVVEKTTDHEVMMSHTSYVVADHSSGSSRTDGDAIAKKSHHDEENFLQVENPELLAFAEQISHRSGLMEVAVLCSSHGDSLFGETGFLKRELQRYMEEKHIDFSTKVDQTETSGGRRNHDSDPTDAGSRALSSHMIDIERAKSGEFSVARRSPTSTLPSPAALLASGTPARQTSGVVQDHEVDDAEDPQLPLPASPSASRGFALLSSAVMDLKMKSRSSPRSRSRSKNNESVSSRSIFTTTPATIAARGGANSSPTALAATTKDDEVVTAARRTRPTNGTTRSNKGSIEKYRHVLYDRKLKMQKLMKSHGLVGFVHWVYTADRAASTLDLMQSAGIGPLQPNCVLMAFPPKDQWDEDDMSTVVQDRASHDPRVRMLQQLWKKTKVNRAHRTRYRLLQALEGAKAFDKLLLVTKLGPGAHWPSIEHLVGHHHSSHGHHQLVSGVAKKPRPSVGTAQQQHPASKPMRGYIDVWWVLGDGGIILLLPHLLRQNPVWAKTKGARLFTVALDNEDLQSRLAGNNGEGTTQVETEDCSAASRRTSADKMRQDLETYCADLRLKLEVHVVPLHTTSIPVVGAGGNNEQEGREDLLDDAPFASRSGMLEVKAVDAAELVPTEKMGLVRKNPLVHNSASFLFNAESLQDDEDAASFIESAAGSRQASKLSPGGPPAPVDSSVHLVPVSAAIRAATTLEQIEIQEVLAATSADTINNSTTSTNSKDENNLFTTTSKEKEAPTTTSESKPTPKLTRWQSRGTLGRSDGGLDLAERLNKVIREHSAESSLVLMNFPEFRGSASSLPYFRLVDTITQGLSRCVLVGGASEHEIVTAFT
ncbi:unnamed protein product [Amoebophrya sp. A120]|nr:unnamed protein product [Amoebophrya sp. A120]|eukprot:GSA120T00002260001.1